MSMSEPVLLPPEQASSYTGIMDTTAVSTLTIHHQDASRITNNPSSEEITDQRGIIALSTGGLLPNFQGETTLSGEDRRIRHCDLDESSDPSRYGRKLRKDDNNEEKEKDGPFHTNIDKHEILSLSSDGLMRTKKNNLDTTIRQANNNKGTSTTITDDDDDDDGDDTIMIPQRSPLRPPRLFQQQRRRRRKHRYHMTNSSLSDECYNNNNNNNDDEKEFDDDTFTGNWSLEDEESSEQRNHRPTTIVDLDVCQQLDLEYDQALEDRQIVWTARYQSVRQSTVVSIVCMVFLIVSGTAFYYKQAEPYWTIPEALLFTIYTITTVGYGHLEMPDTAVFHWYTVAFIFLGIAMLTILVAQVYQCVALEASRVAVSGTHETRRWRSWLEQHSANHQNRQNRHQQQQHPEERTWVEVGLHWYDATTAFLKDNDCGRAVAVVLPFVTMIAFGAMILGPLEGWTVSEAIYFSTVSLTTVGFGEYYPTRTVSIWFCIFWLPCSVGFMSMYLSQVAAFYINMNDNNVQRIETVLRRRLQLAKERAAAERNIILQRALRGQSKSTVTHHTHPSTIVLESDTNNSIIHTSPSDEFRTRTTDTDSDETFEIGSQSLGDLHLTIDDDGIQHRNRRRRHKELDGFQSLVEQPKSKQETRHHHRSPLFGTVGCVAMNRREHIQRAHARGASRRWATMKDVLDSVHSAIEDGSGNDEYLSLRSRPVLRGGVVRDKPSFALRAILLERFAEIIAIDIAGYQSAIEIKEYTLSVTIPSLKQTADKWEVPRRARKAFRAVAFEAVWCVGDHRLITQGVNALLALTPSEFHQIFSPLLAAFGDAETMQLWLAHTQALADVDLKQGTIHEDDDFMCDNSSRSHVGETERPTVLSSISKERLTTFETPILDTIESAPAALVSSREV